MDYNAMPKRVSTLAAEIESKKVLQDEQVRAALDANKRLLYYVSGGKENANMGINDKVRPEDQDLRGWFTEKYGNYLAHLTSDIFNTSGKSNSDRVAEIIAHFNETPFGFTLRTGAVNEYHIGRIVSCANQVNHHRTEARKYSKDLALLCAKLIFSGEAPNNNLFDILHSSIRNWYMLQGVEVKIPFEQMIASGSVFNDPFSTSYNHATYCSEIIFALFDMHTFSMSVDSWHKFPLSQEAYARGTPPMTVAELEEFFNATDGYGSRERIATNNKIKTLYDEYREALKIAQEAEKEGWNVGPKLTQEIKDQIQNQVNFVNTHFDKIEPGAGKVYGPYTSVKNNLAEYVTALTVPVGNPLPRNLDILVPTNANPFGPYPLYNKWNTNNSWKNYDTWRYNTDLYTLRYGEVNTLQAERDADAESGASAADFHKVPAKKIYTEQDQSVSWLVYVYERVSSAYGLPYILDFPPGTNLKGLKPALSMPALPGQVVDSNGVGAFHISKAILFYARALQGVTPSAYWSNTLSHRLVFKEGNGFTDVFLYAANIKTGGVGTTYTDIAKIKGDKDSAAVLIGTYLPDVPLYKPGTNVSLTTQMEDSFASKIKNDPTLKTWLSTSMKSAFNYAYVIRSAWVPSYKVGKFTFSRSPTSLLGTRSRFAMDGFIPEQTVPAADPANNSHADWLRATTWSKSNYKGVSTFKPSMKTLKFDPYGNKQSVPEFYEGRNALTATEMHCVAFPKRAAESIAKFMEGVPALLSEYLNSATNLPNSPWYENRVNVGNWRSSYMQIFNGWNAIETNWPEIPRKRYARAPGSRSTNKTFYDKGAFLDMIAPLPSFMFNRTEALFITDPALAIKRAYATLLQNKPSLPDDFNSNLNYYNTTRYYDHNDFGNSYKSYMALLGAVAYFNSFEMLTDDPSNRTYAPWAKPFAGEINSIVSSVLSGSRPQKIFTTQINDTADVSNMHKTLQSLGAFDEMIEMPVFDLKEFHAVWQPLTSTGSPAIDNPFLKSGYLNVPQGGLKTTIFPGLKGTYGDVFYQTMMETCVLNPVISATTNGYVYSSVRIPVNTRGLSTKVYGMRPGTSYSFSQGSNKTDLTNLFTSGSGRLTYTSIGGVGGLLFAGVLGVAMYRNIANENAWRDRRFEINYD